MSPSSRNSTLFWLVGAGMFALDQITKHWARVRFSLPNGNPDYYQSLPVMGDWIQFRLVYNIGAAFGMKPQGVLPFLSPTLFYAVFSLAAMAFLLVYYRRLKPAEWASRLGVILILSGAAGNLVDRLRFHRVTDFIDAGIPGVFPRWPTFNIADSSVCVGMGILLVFPLLFKSHAHSGSPAPSPDAG